MIRLFWLRIPFLAAFAVLCALYAYIFVWRSKQD